MHPGRRIQRGAFEGRRHLTRCFAAAIVAFLGALMAGCDGHHTVGTAGGSPPPAQTQTPMIASVTIAGDDLTLAPGSKGAYSAQATDASGNPIPSTFTWQSSDASIATVNDGSVTAVAVGHVQITAMAGNIVSAARTVYVNPSQSAEQAIGAAVANGTLTAEQALVYEVWAVFNDARLPGQYRATPDQPQDSHDLVLKQAVDQFESLTPADQDAIGQYLMPPAYWQPSGGSSTSAPATPVVSRLGTRRAAPIKPHLPDYCVNGIPDPHWSYIDTANFFRIWHDSRATDAPAQVVAAPAIGSYAEIAYAALVGTSRFATPVSDAGLVCDGGNNRIDIFIMPDRIGVPAATIDRQDTSGGSTSAAFIEISPGEVAGADLKEAVAHELMHVIQDAYAGMGRASYFWTLDATAVWAETAVYPDSTIPASSFAYFFPNYASQPLFFPAMYTGGLADSKLYASYLFFQFMTQQAGPDAVHEFMTSEANDFLSSLATADDPLKEIDAALSAVGGLTDLWPKFALSLWNQSPLPAAGAQLLPGWDGGNSWNCDGNPSLAASSICAPHTVIQNGNDDVPKVLQLPTTDPSGIEGPVKVNELSSIYDEYDFSPDVHSVVFYNGFTTKMTLQDAGIIQKVGTNTSKSLDGGNTFYMYDPTADAVKGRHIWALKMINGAWSAPEDWTDYAYQPICLDQADQRVTRLVLIFSNGNFTTSRNTSFDQNAVGSIGDQPSTLAVSKTPCWKYQGSATANLTYDDGTDKFTITLSSQATLVGEPTYGSMDLPAGHANVFWGWRFTPDATTSITATAQGIINSCYPGAAVSGSASFAANGAADSYIFPQGTPANNAYSGEIGTPVQFNVSGCSGGTTKLLPAVAPINFNLNFDALLHQDPTSGKLDSSTDAAASTPQGVQSPAWDNGSYSEPGQVTNIWCFFALREGDAGQSRCP